MRSTSHSLAKSPVLCSFYFIRKMSQLETTLELPLVLEEILKRLFCSANREAFSILTRLRTTSATFNRLINDSVLLKIFSSNKKSTLNEVFQHKKINQLIFKSNWDQFEEFIRLMTTYNGANNSRKLIKQRLFYAVKEASLEFVSSFLKFQIEGVAVQFPAKFIIKSLEYAIEKKKNDLALELLPHLKKCFYESDPEHFARVERALKNNEKINIDSDVFYLISRNLKSSVVLLNLLNADERKIIVPEGTLLKLEDIVNDKGFDYSSLLSNNRSMGRYYSTGTRWLFGAKYLTSLNISYFDSKGHQNQIQIERKSNQEKEYTYEDISTSNIYELVVTTSLGTQLLKSFPRQFVAVTDQALNLPFKDQPWFFGNISHREAKNIVLGSASNMFFLTVSYGADVTVYWSEPKRGGRDDILTFPLRSINELRNYIEKAMKLLNPVLGFYNGGTPKNVDVFKFHRLLTNETLREVRNEAALFLQENKLDISTIRNPSPLWTYLQRHDLNDGDIEWLIENKVYLHGDEKPSIVSQMIAKKGKDSGKSLLNLGVKCDTSALVELLAETPSREMFKLFWDARTDVLDYYTILSKLFEVAGAYENERKDAIEDGFGEKRKLIALAWRFGNDDNLFKMLPIEILQSILQYDIDVPYWYSIAEMIVYAPKQRIRPTPKLGSIESVLFVAKYRHLFEAADQAIDAYFDFGRINSPNLPTILRQLKRIDPSFMIKSGGGKLVQNCINKSNVDLLREVVETKIFDPSAFEITTKLGFGFGQHDTVPYVWFLCFQRNKEIVELLSRNGLMPLECIDQLGRTLQLKTWLEYQCVKEDMYALVEWCIAEGNQ